MEIDKDILSAGGWPHPCSSVYAALRVPTMAGRAGRREKRGRAENASTQPRSDGMIPVWRLVRI